MKKIKKTFLKYIKILKETPFRTLLMRIFQKFLNFLKDTSEIIKSFFKGPYISDKDFFNEIGGRFDLNLRAKIISEIKNNVFLNSILKIEDRDYILNNISQNEKDEVLGISERIFKHEFDLLGSGNIKIVYNLKPIGFEGFVYSNNVLDEKRIGEISKRIFSRVKSFFNSSLKDYFKISDYEYEPIDWHVDFKSGYRWQESTWYKKIKYGELDGVDVKNPWELSRLQYLMILAQSYIITRDEKYTVEYIYQVTDWFENNSYPFGVNWKCTMDVAIRAANLVLSFALFKESKLVTDDFIIYFTKHIYLHGKHIINNLEYSSITSNHYLSDISGLIFVANFLDNLGKGIAWNKFALNELKKEMDKQIYEDGFDFEASTCYHRLVIELFLYSSIYLIKKADSLSDKNYQDILKKIFGDRFSDKLYRMFEAMLHCIKPDGEIPQIGDNDNGRFFIFYNRDVTDFKYLLQIGAIFFSEQKFNIKEFDYNPEISWIFGKYGRETFLKLKESSINNITSKSFDIAGIFVMRKNKNYLIISCGPNGQNGNGGHAHNDKLGFELSMDGIDLIVDNGTYVYTASAYWRNRFRSTACHNTIMVDRKEQNRFIDKNLFTLENDAYVKINRWHTGTSIDYLDAEHYGYKKIENPIVHRRIIIFNKSKPFWIVKDILSGKGEHIFNSFFHLGSGLNVKTENSTMVIEIFYKHRKMLSIIPLIIDKLSFNEESSFLSKCYGIKNKTVSLNFSKVVTAPTEFIFLMIPFNEDPSYYLEKTVQLLKNT